MTTPWQPIDINISVRTRNGGEGFTRLPAVQHEDHPGLAYHKRYNEQRPEEIGAPRAGNDINIIHVGSGKLVVSDFVGPMAARRALLKLAPVVDWTLPGEQLLRDAGWENLYELVTEIREEQPS